MRPAWNGTDPRAKPSASSVTMVVAIATTIVTLDALGFARGSVPFHLGLILLNVAAVVILFVLLDRGRVLSPAYSRLSRVDVEKLREMSTPRRAAPFLPESGD